MSDHIQDFGTIKPPPTPRFMLAPAAGTDQLYIVCTAPLALIWVEQRTPARLFILKGPNDEAMLRAAGDFYRETVGSMLGGN